MSFYKMNREISAEFIQGQGANVRAFWSYVCELASHQARPWNVKGQVYALSEGQFHTTAPQIAKDMKVGPKVVSRLMARFRGNGLISTALTYQGPVVTGMIVTVPWLAAEAAATSERAAAAAKLPQIKGSQPGYPSGGMPGGVPGYPPTAEGVAAEGVQVSQKTERGTPRHTPRHTPRPTNQEGRTKKVTKKVTNSLPPNPPQLEDELIVIQAEPAPLPAAPAIAEGAGEDEFLMALSYATQNLNIVPRDVELLKFEQNYRMGGFTFLKIKGLVDEVLGHALLSADTHSLNRLFTLVEARKDTRKRAGLAMGEADRLRLQGKTAEQAFACLYESAAVVPHNADIAKRKEHCAFLVWSVFNEDIFNFEFEKMASVDRLRKYA